MRRNALISVIAVFLALVATAVGCLAFGPLTLVVAGPLLAALVVLLTVTTVVDRGASRSRTRQRAVRATGTAGLMSGFYETAAITNHEVLIDR